MKQKIFVFFWLPYAVKYTYDTFFTAFFLAASKFPPECSIHIGAKKFFELALAEYPNHVNHLSHYYGISTANIEQIENINKIFINPDIFQDLQEKYIANNLVWKHLLTDRHFSLENELDNILQVILVQQDIEAIIAWCNTPSLSYIAKKYGLKVIHNEMGPLRKPYYMHTAYFDYSGVNGNTEASKRFQNFKEEYKVGKVSILQKESLLNLFSTEEYVVDVFSRTNINYDIGLPLQVEDDSNILAFSNGINSWELINIAQSKSSNIAIRQHPAGRFTITTDCAPSKINPIQFIRQCNQVMTINSSMGFEGLLYNKKVYILGESPFKFITQDLSSEENIVEDELLKINFILFGYLIPFCLMYDVDYYQWRLTMPSELEIYDFHFKYYQKHKNTDKLSNIANKLTGLTEELNVLRNQLEHNRQELQHTKQELQGTTLELEAGYSSLSLRYIKILRKIKNTLNIS